MLKIIFLLLLASIISFYGKVSTVRAQEEEPYVERVLPASQPSQKIVVQFKSIPKSADLLAVKESTANVDFLSGITNSASVVYELKSGTISNTLSSLQANPTVQSAFLMPRVFSLKVTDDTQQQKQWSLRTIKIAGSGQTGWDLVPDIDQKTRAVKVAIVDSGVDKTHPDINEKIAQNDFVACATNGCQTGDTIKDKIGHGTHVAGVVGAWTNNHMGIASVGWSVRLMSVKILGDDGSGDLDVALKGITWAADHGADIINMSFGAIEQNLTDEAKTQIQQTIDYAWNKGIVLVAAAGNCGAANNNGNVECAIFDTNGNVTGFATNPKYYPAASDHVLSVGSLAKDNTKAPYSEYGGWIDVVAPGGSCTSQADKKNCILSTYPPSLITQPPNPTPTIAPYAYMAGTSMSTPHVSGLAALILASHPDFSNEKIVNIIKSTTNTSVGGSPNSEKGLINAVAALQANPPDVTTTPEVSATPVPSNVTPSPTQPPDASPTPTEEPDPVGHLIKTSPSPYPPPPYCPNNDQCILRPYGDANCDGNINKEDYRIWNSQYDTLSAGSDVNDNANFACEEADVNSRFVDLLDFEQWRETFFDGRPLPGPTDEPISPTPNPSITGGPSVTPTEAKAVLYGRMWLDSNKNGVKDDAEKYIGDMNINLIQVQKNGKEKVIDTVKSRKSEQEQGRNYTFRKVENGTYKLNTPKLGDYNLISCNGLKPGAQVPEKRYFYCRQNGKKLMKWDSSQEKKFKQAERNVFHVEGQNMIVDFPLESGRN